jgi:hypothetical protein
MKHYDAVVTEVHKLIGQQIHVLTQELTPESASAYIQRKQRILDLTQVVTEKPTI